MFGPGAILAHVLLPTIVDIQSVMSCPRQLHFNLKGGSNRWSNCSTNSLDLLWALQSVGVCISEDPAGLSHQKCAWKLFQFQSLLFIGCNLFPEWTGSNSLLPFLLQMWIGKLIQQSVLPLMMPTTKDNNNRPTFLKLWSSRGTSKYSPISTKLFTEFFLHEPNNLKGWEIKISNFHF